LAAATGAGFGAVAGAGTGACTGAGEDSAGVGSGVSAGGKRYVTQADGIIDSLPLNIEVTLNATVPAHEGEKHR